jgi:hypothetical protein
MKDNGNKKLIRAVRKLTAEVAALRRALRPPGAKAAAKKVKKKKKKANKAKQASSGEPETSASGS